MKDKRIPEGPYFVTADDAEDCPDHNHSGLAKVDTGRAGDWPIARLCEWPTAELIAKIPEMLATITDQRAENERLQEENEKIKSWVAGYQVQLGIRDQELAELRAEIERWSGFRRKWK